MEKKNSGYLVAIIALAIAVVGMSVGFAFSNIDLTIEGNNVTAKAATWDVHFDPASVNVTTESVEATTAANAIETAYTTATYAVTLTQPGDFYEFTIDAKNYGTFDAKLASYSFSAVPSISTDDPYIKHTLKYNGTEIAPGTVSGTVLEPFSKTPAAKDTYTVRVEYLKPTDSDNLPTEDVDYKFTVTLVYAEALEETN